MDALEIALETIIVGALALPWMFLLNDLFCPEKEHLFKQLLELLDRKAVATVAGAVALSLAYLRSFGAEFATDFCIDNEQGSGSATPFTTIADSTATAAVSQCGARNSRFHSPA